MSNKEGKLIIIPNGVTTNIQLMQQQQANSQQPFSTTTQINTDQINFKVRLYQLYLRKYKKYLCGFKIFNEFIIRIHLQIPFSKSQLPTSTKQQMHSLPINQSYQILPSTSIANGDNEVLNQITQNKLILPGVIASRYISIIPKFCLNILLYSKSLNLQ